MNLGIFEYYLIAVNIIGFILFAINTWLYTYTPTGQIDKALTIFSLLGGLLAMYLFRHKTSKDYFTVGIPLIMVMQVVVLFYLTNIT